jgi:Flp pilus assembly protein TadB
VASSQQFPHRVTSGASRFEPVLITEAEPSQDDQHAARKKRYIITMGIRGVSLVLAAVTYQIVWLMIIFAVLGTVLPWIAVVMANDRPPKKRLHVNRYTPPQPDRILESGPKARVIDM